MPFLLFFTSHFWGCWWPSEGTRLWPQSRFHLPPSQGRISFLTRENAWTPGDVLVLSVKKVFSEMSRCPNSGVASLPCHLVLIIPVKGFTFAHLHSRPFSKECYESEMQGFSKKMKHKPTPVTFPFTHRRRKSTQLERPRFSQKENLIFSALPKSKCEVCGEWGYLKHRVFNSNLPAEPWLCLCWPLCSFLVAQVWSL